MDPLRRGAMVKAMRVGAGALAGLSSLGNSQGNANRALDQAAPTRGIGYASTGTEKSPNEWDDPTYQARRKAAEPLRREIEELHGHGGWQLSRFQYAANETAYLSALRSTAPWWRASVAMDRQKAKSSAIEKLQAQIDQLMRSPLDALEETFRDAVNGFLVEMQKP